MTPDDVCVLEADLEWTAADVTDPDAWTYRLSAAEHSELDAALAHARTVSDEVLDITRGDFPLDTLVPVLDNVAQQLINGRGFHRIAGLDVDRLGPEDASWMYWGIGMHLGAPWPQNHKGHLLGDVRDQGKSYDDPTARGNEIGGAALTFHSDGSDLVGLMCINSGVSGGESLVSNALAAHNQLVRTEPELAAALYDGLPYDFRGEEAKGGTPFYKVPPFTRHNDRLFVRYIRPYIESSQRHENAPPITDLQRSAMDAYDAFVLDENYWVEMALEPGDMQFINNYHVLHGRRSYIDNPEAGQVRWLKRLWLATDILGPDDRPDRYQASGSMNHWGRNRTRA
jgi:hypothetical protein